MDSQIQRQGIETHLQQAMLQNQRLYFQKYQQIINQFKHLSNQSLVSTQQFMENIHLDAARKYFEHYAQNKRKEVEQNLQLMKDEQEKQINQQLKNIALRDKLQLQDWIQKINVQIQQSNTRIKKYHLAQKHAYNQIMQLNSRATKSQFLVNQSFNLSSNPSLLFTYSQNPQGRIQFNKSYMDIVNHNLKRIKQNESIIVSLQNSIKQQLKQCQLLRSRYETQKILRQNHTRVKKNIQNITAKIQKTKKHLNQLVVETSQQIDSKLNKQLSIRATRMMNQKQNYDKAFFSLIQIAKNIEDNVNIQTINGIIHQN